MQTLKLWNLLTFLMIALTARASAQGSEWTRPSLPFGEKTKVKCLRADPGGCLWVIPSDLHEIAVLDFNNKAMRLGDSIPGTATFIDAAFEEIAGAYLLSTEGLVRISKEGQRKTLAVQGLTTSAPFTGSIVSSPGLGMIVAVPGHGLILYSPGSGEEMCVPKGEALPSVSFSSRPAVSENRIWLATSDEGLISFSPEHKTARRVGFPGGPWPPVTDLIADWADNVWIATKRGLYRAKGDTILKVQYPGEEAAVKSLALRGSQEIWVLLESGRLFVYNPLFGWLPREAAYPGALGTPSGPMEGNTRGDLWIVTSKGLHHLAGTPEATPGTGVSKIWALKVVCESSANSAYRLSLPVDSGTESLWYWGAFIMEGGASTPGPGSWAVEEKEDGSRSVSISGDFKSIEHFSGASALVPRPPATTHGPLPFPAEYPEEVKEYLMPGAFIPSDNKQIIETAESLVSPEARNDMGLTISDLVYSSLFREMPVDFLDPFVPTTFASKGTWPFNREAVDVLRDNRGDTSGKSRLLCSLSRSRGIPARVVRRSDGLYAWCEVWLSKAGWIAADVTAPLFALSSRKRPQLPKEKEAGDYFTTYPSGRDDEGGVLTVSSCGKCIVSSGDLAAVKNAARLAQSRLLIFRPAARAPGWDSRLPVTKQLSAYLVTEKWGMSKLVIGNREKTVQCSWPLVSPGKTITCAIPGHLLLSAIPRFVGNLVIFEVHKWESWEQ
jgi:hypothetical protein